MISTNPRRGRKDRVKLSCGVSPNIYSRLVRASLATGRPMVQLVEESLLRFLPPDVGQPVVTPPRQFVCPEHLQFK